MQHIGSFDNIFLQEMSNNERRRNWQKNEKTQQKKCNSNVYLLQKVTNFLTKLLFSLHIERKYVLQYFDKKLLV